MFLHVAQQAQAHVWLVALDVALTACDTYCSAAAALQCTTWTSRVVCMSAA